MPPDLEALARSQHDNLLARAGWVVQHFAKADIHLGYGVPLREFPLSRFGTAVISCMSPVKPQASSN
jgi:hypothetical protein